MSIYFGKESIKNQHLDTAPINHQVSCYSFRDRIPSKEIQPKMRFTAKTGLERVAITVNESRLTQELHHGGNQKNKDLDDDMLNESQFNLLNPHSVSAAHPIPMGLSHSHSAQGLLPSQSMYRNTEQSLSISHQNQYARNLRPDLHIRKHFKGATAMALQLPTSLKKNELAKRRDQALDMEDMFSKIKDLGTVFKRSLQPEEIQGYDKNAGNRSQLVFSKSNNVFPFDTRYPLKKEKKHDEGETVDKKAIDYLLNHSCKKQTAQKNPKGHQSRLIQSALLFGLTKKLSRKDLNFGEIKQKVTKHVNFQDARATRLERNKDKKKEEGEKSEELAKQILRLCNVEKMKSPKCGSALMRGAGKMICGNNTYSNKEIYDKLGLSLVSHGEHRQRIKDIQKRAYCTLNKFPSQDLDDLSDLFDTY